MSVTLQAEADGEDCELIGGLFDEPADGHVHALDNWQDDEDAESSGTHITPLPPLPPLHFTKPSQFLPLLKFPCHCLCALNPDKLHAYDCETGTWDNHRSSTS